MAFYKQDIVDINLNTGNIHRSFLNHAIGYKNDDADRFGIRTFRDGVPQDLTGASCQAVFMAPNGSKIALTSYGTVSGNVAYVTLPPACYDYDGQFCLAIQLVGGGVTGTMRIVDGMVVNTGASGTVAPTSAVPTYQEIIAQYDAMVAATAAANGAIAATYSGSATYKIGDYCIHDGGLYRCTTAITTAEAWNAAHWTATKIGPDVSDLKSAINYIGDELACNTKTILKSSIGTDGVIAVNSGKKLVCFRVNAGTQITATGSVELYGFFTSEPSMGSVTYNNSRTQSSSLSNVTVPAGCTWVAIRTPLADEYTISISPASVVKIIEDKIGNINSMMENYNCKNIFHYTERYTADGETSGITFTRVEPDGVKIKGTASANVSFNFFAYNSGFPVGLVAGQKIYCLLKDDNNSNITLNINKYDPSTGIYSIKPNTYTEVTIPNDATGIAFYVRIPQNAVVDTTVYFLITDFKSEPNYTLTEKTEKTFRNYLRTRDSTAKNLFDRNDSGSIVSPSDGISMAYSEDYGHFFFSGTPAAATVSFNIWIKNNILPLWWSAGQKRVVSFNCDAQIGTYTLKLYWYDNETDSHMFETLQNGIAKEVTLPAEAYGIAFQFQITASSAVSGNLVICVTDNALPIENITTDLITLKNQTIPNIQAEIDSLSFDGDAYRDLYKSIYRIGVIGDSYSAIRLYERNGDTSSHPYDSQFYSWFGYLQRESGMSYVNLAASGYECKDWIDGTQDRPELFTTASQEANLCQVYLICMGLNDSARHDTSYVGTTADINVTDPDQNAASFIGYYAKIIQKLRAIQPKALFIVYTMPTSSGATGLGRYEAYNTGIRAIAEFFDYVYLADLYADYYDLYHTEGLPLKNPDGAFVTAGHYTAEVQPIIAKIMSSEISKIIKNNQAAFCNIEYTGGKKWGPTN